MGLTQLLTAVFHVDVNSFGPKSIAYNIHNWVFIVSAGSFPFGALLLVPNLWSDKRWRRLAYITIIAGVAALTLDLLWLVSRPIEPHLIDPWFGVYERILLTIPLAWMVGISIRLLFLVRRQLRY
jgi:peptidoglycan biosynthesis protein MviN/MurJ (putative lipid II flippase)